MLGAAAWRVWWGGRRPRRGLLGNGYAPPSSRAATTPGRREERSRGCLRRPHGIRRRLSLTGRPVFSYGRHMVGMYPVAERSSRAKGMRPAMLRSAFPVSRRGVFRHPRLRLGAFLFFFFFAQSACHQSYPKKRYTFNPLRFIRETFF